MESTGGSMSDKDVARIIKEEGGTVIMRCYCTSAFQDKHYGMGMRVHNVMASLGNKARCTVCGDVKQ